MLIEFDEIMFFWAGWEGVGMGDGLGYQGRWLLACEKGSYEKVNANVVLKMNISTK